MSASSESRLDAVLAEIDPTRPHPARIYDYFLGGKDNFAADRAVAEQAIEAWPQVIAASRENRAFVGRAVRCLAIEHGVDQFIDIGSGLPTANNVHEVAQGVIRSAQVVYVDNDPIVHAHARALLTSSVEGRCAYIKADLRQPDTIIGDPAVSEMLDHSRPVALILTAILHFLGPADHPEWIIKTLVDALPSGSYVIATHATSQYPDPEPAVSVARAYQQGGVGTYLRSVEEFRRLVFSGFDLMPPGIVASAQWHPDAPTGCPPLPADICMSAAVGRKP